ncbi:Peptidoglycan O-acetyltransferase [Fundidesulfovibrio magnetotacticus]|uniref:Peptidoglycan O-acetyltransferase n=1 Tax=Fundidesulfovibrio magnetotacticus TaxID=2730080 RepID=A0A6V8LSZ1_9BACT|nr:MBOAT family protein [Fundidesulfovibrio magnetotacticus]GFK93701.1 Peptidoglycan O-acetyltransferase [Fundidesulfovibrio magnetotacticus]
MAVDSPLFLFVFLPVLLGLFALCPARGREALLLGASLLFYALSDAASLPLFLASMAFNMLMGLAISWAGGGARKALLALGVGLDLAFLAWAKYPLFLAAQIPGLEGLRALAPASMPLGVSFFTFSAIAYLVDVAGRRQDALADPVRFGLFLAFFPKVAAGPIARCRDMAPHAPTLEGLRDGLTRLAVGLAKKTLVAAPLGRLADQAFALPSAELDMGTAWLGLLAYSLQLYFDFSGYTDMAVGLGRLFGYNLPENFNYPYTAQSVREFWRRWHLTLSTWFRDYLYIPLGGGRAAPWKVQRNLLIVFTLCGLWHGASWSFVVWGLWHGLFLALERTGVGKRLDALPRPARHAYALLAVGLGWVFFRAPDFAHAWGYFKALASFSFHGWDYTWTVRVNRETLCMLAAGILGSAPALPWLGERLGRLMPLARGLAAPALLALALLALAAGAHTPFIYAQF